MIRRAFAALTAVALLGACAGAPLPAPHASGVPLDHLPVLKGQYFRIVSRETKRPYHIYIRYPEGYSSAAAERYPVVYLLDGDSLFPLLAASHLFLHYDEQLPEAIVVGIAYGSFDPAVNQRDVDYTGPAEGLAPEKAGAAAFQRFLKSELLPEVEGRTRADPARRILFGQSRGGSFVLYSAFTDPDLFWGRIASNPNIDIGRALFFGPPAAGSRSDLALVVTSASRDRPRLREGALAWFKAWQGRTDAPWAIETRTIEDATHAADAPRSYRAGMLWLFRRQAR